MVDENRREDTAETSIMRIMKMIVKLQLFAYLTVERGVEMP
jgi:hypothetical protein